MNELVAQSSDVNLTSMVSVFDANPLHADNSYFVVVDLQFGNGTKDLDGSGGEFTYRIEIDGVRRRADQIVEFDALTQVGDNSAFAIPVPANKRLQVYAMSPNVADTDVNVTTRIFDLGGTPVDTFVGLIRTDLTTELDRIDAPISSVEASVDEEAIADAVRFELATELGRIDQPISAIDVSIGDVMASIEPEDIRAAIGLEAANLDTQLSQVVATMGGNFVISQTSKQLKPSTLTAFIGETKTHTVFPIDEDGEPVDVSGLTLRVIIETRAGGKDLVVIEDEDITKDPTFYSFTVPGGVHSKVQEYRWGCRRVDTKQPIGFGLYKVMYAPGKDD